MDISHREIKALASDTRVMIMKSLGGRRKMPSELSREFSMAPSTIVEHLHVLERSGLIKKIETGHKWKYYELTEKGKSLVRPKFPVQFAVMLSLGVLLVFGSFAGILAGYPFAFQAKDAVAGAPVLERCATVSAPLAEAVPNPPFLIFWMPMLLLIGILFIIFAAVKLWSKWK
jgi:DNA-binding transcriptional ArsR family regulator